MSNLIVDANAWAHVFDQKNSIHVEFSQIRNFILSRKVTLAWGGEKYRKELAKCEKYLRLHLEFTKSGIAIHVCDIDVDAIELEVSNFESDPDFDDPHMIALQIVSKSVVIVSVDKRAHKFFKSKSLYPPNHPKPKIYTSRRSRGAIAAIRN